MQLAQRGKAVVGVTTHTFFNLAQRLLEQQGGKELPLVSVPHPVGGLSPQQAAALITDELVAEVARGLSTREPEGSAR